MSRVSCIGWVGGKTDFRCSTVFVVVSGRCGTYSRLLYGSTVPARVSIRRRISTESYWFGQQYNISGGVGVSEGRSARSLVNRVVFYRRIGAELIGSGRIYIGVRSYQ